MSTTTDQRKYQLIYFNGRGRGECLRLMFMVANCPFDDCRITIKQWNTIRQQYGLDEKARLPMLVIVGDTEQFMLGSTSIGRYLANKFKLYGRSDDDRKRIDSIVESIECLYPSLTPVVRAALAKNDLARRRYWDEYKSSTLDAAFDQLTKILGSNRFFVGLTLTWADLAVAEITSRFESCYDGMCLQKYPELRDHRERVERLPAIARWTYDRPHALF